MKQIIAELAPVLRGWGHYFRSGYADREFQSDGFLGEEESPSLAVSAKRTAPPLLPANRLTEWTCIVCRVLRDTRRKPHLEDHR